MASEEAAQQANRSGMDPRRLVVIFLLMFGIVLGLFLAHVLGLILARFNVADTRLIEGLDESSISTLGGFVLAAALMVALWVLPRPKAISHDVANELMKVSWPSWGETRVSTVAVVIASVVAAVVLFAIDTVAYKLMVEWLPAVWGKL